MAKKRKTIEPVEEINNRRSREYLQWRKLVIQSSGNTCDKCGKFSPNGKGLEAHHLNSFTDNEELQVADTNGVCLCKECHKAFHKIYKNNCTEEDYHKWKASFIHKGVKP